MTANIPYKIVGGVNFYARREIKDLLSYLKTVDNGQDDLAVRRIINVPKRGSVLPASTGCRNTPSGMRWDSMRLCGLWI